METHILFQGKNDPPQLADMKRPVLDLAHIPKITFCLIEGGMQSGEPSVIIMSEAPDGSIVLQTSLDKFLAAATSMMAGAEKRWGWKQPTGYVTIMPPDKETRKAMLESISKELQEWED